VSFDAWHQWLPLRLLIVFLMTLLGAIALALIASLAEWRSGRHTSSPVAETDSTPSTLGRERSVDVPNLGESVAPRAESTPGAWGGEGVPSDRRAA
jgi:hypothetical protein